MKKLYITIVIIMALCADRAGAQDAYFSQAHRAPLALNPALVGKSQDKQWRVQSNLRSQWWGGGIQPYLHGVMSVEHSRDLGAESNSVAFALGVLSESSNGGVLKRTLGNFGMAYHNVLDADGYHMLSAGLLGTFANRLIDLSRATTESQMPGMAGTPMSGAYDPAINGLNRYWDVQVGLGYDFRGDRLTGHLGAAMFHAARPRESVFNDGNYRMAVRKVLEGSLRIDRGEETGNTWMFRGVAQLQGGHNTMQLSADYTTPISLEGNHTITFGLGGRLRDAFFPYVQLDMNSFSVGLSYDAVVGDLYRYYNKVRSTELTFAYSFGEKE